MRVIENVKNNYNDLTLGGEEHQLISIGFTIAYLPALMLEHSKYKIIRLIGLMLCFAWIVPTLPVIAFFLLIGFFQFVWQEI